MVVNVIKSCYIFLIKVKTQQQQNERDERIQTCCILLVTTKTTKKWKGWENTKKIHPFRCNKNTTTPKKLEGVKE